MATVSIRYIVRDVDAAIDFYCRHLGFHEVMHPAPTFAMLTRGDLRVTLATLLKRRRLLGVAAHPGPDPRDAVGRDPEHESRRRVLHRRERDVRAEVDVGELLKELRCAALGDARGAVEDEVFVQADRV